jgi:hypothetical protein
MAAAAAFAGGDDLGRDRDGGLLGRARADVEPDRRVDARDIVVGDARFAQGRDPVSGTSNFTSCVSTMSALRSSTRAPAKNSSGQATITSSASGMRARVANSGRASTTVTR